jgi:ribosomal protein L11 methyltransferase
MCAQGLRSNDDASPERWLSVKLDVPAALAEPLSDWLSAAGALAVTAADAADAPIFEPNPDEQPLWPTVCLDALFASDTDRDGLRAAIARWFAAQDAPAPELRVEEVPDQDWSRTWRIGIAPQVYRDRLHVVPRDHVHVPGAVAVLRLDPGLAFGTGGHPTTALCLDWLAAADLDGLAVVDYGCGSGILGIAALLLGAATVAAVDHDPQALRAAGDNATANGIAGERFTAYAPNALPTRAAGYDVVIANILANPLIALAPHLTSLLSSGGRLVLSGLLEDQVPAVTAAYPAVRFMTPAVRDGWVRLDGIVEPGWPSR